MNIRLKVYKLTNDPYSQRLESNDPEKMKQYRKFLRKRIYGVRVNRRCNGIARLVTTH